MRLAADAAPVVVKPWQNSSEGPLPFTSTCMSPMGRVSSKVSSWGWVEGLARRGRVALCTACAMAAHRPVGAAKCLISNGKIAKHGAFDRRRVGG